MFTNLIFFFKKIYMNVIFKYIHGLTGGIDQNKLGAKETKRNESTNYINTVRLRQERQTMKKQ